MLLLGVVSGVALAAHEARRGGLDPEVVFSFAFYVFLGGIVGARLFYVIEYWPQFQRETVVDTVGAVLNVTQGGLVVYGSLIGGAGAGIGYLYTHRLPILAMADLVAPSLLLGLAIGRIGCLLNGCCHGGICHDQRLGITFPKGSPPYIQQCELGEMYGFHIAKSSTSKAAVVDKVEPNGLAAAAGLSRGTVIQSVNGVPVESYIAARAALRSLPAELFVETDQGTAHIRLEKIPDRSRPVHPTQIYSTINAGLICLLLWAFYPFRRRDGEVFALALLLYPITRILLEAIRTDEPGQLGTSLTISQILSLVLFAISILLWVYILRRPRGTALPVATDKASVTAP
jgi:phosphatidylglycerol:prolipoprotein diacylglycerol transferase